MAIIERRGYGRRGFVFAAIIPMADTRYLNDSVRKIYSSAKGPASQITAAEFLRDENLTTKLFNGERR